MVEARQYLLTVEEGKKLISRAVAAMEWVREAAREHTLVIVAGTTNGYLAEIMLDQLGERGDFTRVGFRRGANTPPGVKAETGPFANTDVVIRRGEWLRGKTVYDVAEELGPGDVIVKGANALQPDGKAAAVQIGHPQGGTIVPILRAVERGHARLVIPVGLEKRVSDSVEALAALLEAHGTPGPKLRPVTGDIVTEVEAFKALTGARAVLVAAGGVAGAEGGCTFALIGGEEELARAAALVKDLRA
ncbi:MAG: hypothetical protein IKO07_04485 [Clostridia bacterium]|nr:hypothetical protein [Clostridia bacterium]